MVDMNTPPNTPKRQAGRRSPSSSRGALGATLVLLALAPAAGALAPAAWAASATITVLGPASGGYAETGAGVLPPLSGVVAADASGAARPASSPPRGGGAASAPDAAAPARSLVAPVRAAGGPVVVAAGSLPYTGLDLWVLLAAAVGLIGTGLALRRASHAPAGRRHSS